MCGTCWPTKAERVARRAVLTVAVVIILAVLVAACCARDAEGAPPNRIQVVSTRYESVTKFYIVRDAKTGQEFMVACQSSHNGGCGMARIAP